MQFFPGADELLFKLLNHIVEKYPEFVAIGGYVSGVMAIGTVTLTLAIIYLSISVPVELVHKIYKDK